MAAVKLAKKADLTAETAARAAADTAFDGRVVDIEADGIDHVVGAGYDLIVGLGQSNMSGRGKPYSLTYTDPVHHRIYQYGDSGAYENVISQAVEPLAMHDTPTGIGPLLQFAHWYAEASVTPNRRILLVPVAQGGTGFNSTPGWDSADTDELYDNAVAQALAALAAAGQGSRVVAFLWVQGEADAQDSMTGATYATKLDTLIDALRSEVADVPFVVGQMLPEYIDAAGGTVADINAAHIDTPNRKLRTAFAYGPAGKVQEDGLAIHYSGSGQRILGERIWRALERAEANVEDVAPLVPTGLALTQVGATIEASWDQPVGRVTDFTVEYRVQGAGSWTTLTRAQSIDVNATIPITKGTTYEARVASVNEEGTSAFSAAVTLVTVTDPAQVTGLATGAPTGAAVPLTWSAAARATSYVVEYKKTADPGWTEFAEVAGLASTPNTLIALTAYDFRVTARNAAADAAPSSTESETTTAVGYLFAELTAAPTQAYGMRKLVTSYAGSAIRVRRSSDDAEADIGFDVNGLCDAAAILTHVGAGDGFVTKWYDQSGSARDVLQATAAKQPKVATSGAVELQNGKPTVVFDGVDDLLTNTTPTLWDAAAASIESVLAGQAKFARVLTEGNNVSTANLYEPFCTEATGKASAHIRDENAVDTLLENTVGVSDTFLDDATLHQQAVIDRGFRVDFYTDGGAVKSSATYSRLGVTLTLNVFTIGALKRNAESLWERCKISELVCWGSALDDTDRGNVSLNQHSYYGTP